MVTGAVKEEPEVSFSITAVFSGSSPEDFPCSSPMQEASSSNAEINQNHAFLFTGLKVAYFLKEHPAHTFMMLIIMNILITLGLGVR